MFDGKVRTTRRVTSHAGGRRQRENASRAQSNEDLIEQARRQREARSWEKHRQDSCIRIQSSMRRYYSNQHLQVALRTEFDESMANVNKMCLFFASKSREFMVPTAVIIRLLHIIYHLSRSRNADLDRLCKVLHLFNDMIHRPNILQELIVVESKEGEGGQQQQRDISVELNLFSDIINLALQGINTAVHDMDVEMTASSNSSSNLSVLVSTLEIVPAVLTPYIHQLKQSKATSGTENLIIWMDKLIDGIVMQSAMVFSSCLDFQASLNMTVDGSSIICRSIAILESILVESLDLEANRVGWRALVKYILVRPQRNSSMSVSDTGLLATLNTHLCDHHFAGWKQSIAIAARLPTRETTPEQKLNLIDNFISSLHDQSSAGKGETSVSNISATLLQHKDWLQLLISVLETDTLYLHDREDSTLIKVLMDSKFISNAFGVSIQQLSEHTSLSSALKLGSSNDDGNVSDLISLSHIYALVLVHAEYSSTKKRSLDISPSTNIQQRKNSINSSILTQLVYRPPEFTKHMWNFLHDVVHLKVRDGSSLVISRKGMNGAKFETHSGSIVQFNPFENIKSTTMAINQQQLKLMFLFFCMSFSKKLELTVDDDFFAQEFIVGRAQVEELVAYLNRVLLHFYRFQCRQSREVSKSNVLISALSDLDTTINQALYAASADLFNKLYAIEDRQAYMADPQVWQWVGVSEMDLKLENQQSDHQQGQHGHQQQHHFGGIDRDLLWEAGDNAGNAFVNNNHNNGDDEEDMSEEETEDDHDTDSIPVENPIMRHVLQDHPQVLPFRTRVDIFERSLLPLKSRYMGHWGGNMIQVNRENLAMDSYNKMKQLDKESFRGRIQVQFVSKQGYVEAGIDGGGLFKEFLDECIHSLLDTEFGLFKGTSSQLLVPTSTSSKERLDVIRFVGKMVGKAVFENILVESEFSPLFLNVLLGKRNSFDDLRYLDEQIYQSMRSMQDMYKQKYDIEELGLVFEVDHINENNQLEMKELVPNGSEVKVTRNNFWEYVMRYAHYKLNVEMWSAAMAFKEGMSELIPLEWIKLFSPRELQQLISGERKGIDVTDIRRHVQYAGGYNEQQPYVQGLWQIISEMTPEQQGNLLKFITSCSRQPLRGFGQMDPKVCIQKVPQYSTEQLHAVNEQGEHVTPTPMMARLPSASTCVNLLKLPQYDSIEILREKLLWAITNNNAGFELS